MKYKILIGEDNKIEREILIKILNKNFNCEIIEATNGLDVLRKIKKELPNILLLDIDLPKLNGFQVVEKLKEDMTTADIPIIIISSLNKKIIVERLIFNNVKDIITKPINEKSDLISKISNVLNFESKFIGSYTNRFIKSFVTFSSSQTKALQMISLLEAILRKIRIDAQKKMDMKAVLSILSTTIEKSSLNKTIKLYSDMNFANDILNLLNAVKNPKTIEEEIIYLIYEVVKAEYENKNVYDIKFKKIDRDLLNLMFQIVQENKIVVSSNLDLELVWIKLMDITSNDSNIDIDLIDKFISYIKNILRKILLKNGQTVVKIINTTDKLKFLIYSPYCTENNLKDLSEQNENKNITKYIKNINEKNYLILELDKNLKENINKKIEEVKVIEIIEDKKEQQDSKQQELLKKSVVNNVISAQEYISDLNIDFENDLEEMRELEEELDSNLVFLSQQFNIQDLKEIGNIILKYANRINNTFYEFEALGYGLTSLSNIIIHLNDINYLDNTLVVFLSDLKEDLSKWRENIFIEQNAINVHYLDSSMLSSCMQMEALLKNEEIEGEEIEFF